MKMKHKRSSLTDSETQHTALQIKVEVRLSSLGWSSTIHNFVAFMAETILSAINRLRSLIRNKGLPVISSKLQSSAVNAESSCTTILFLQIFFINYQASANASHYVKDRVFNFKKYCPVTWNDLQTKDKR